jgi:hypothetical protein
MEPIIVPIILNDPWVAFGLYGNYGRLGKYGRRIVKNVIRATRRRIPLGMKVREMITSVTAVWISFYTPS